MSNNWRAIFTEQGANFGKGASEAELTQLERELGCPLPTDYRAFLQEVGWAEIETESGLLSLAGLGADVPSELDLSAIVREARGAGLGAHLLPVADEGDFLFIDTQTGAVVYLEEAETHQLAESFTAWLSAELSE